MAQALPRHDSGFGEFMHHPVDYTRKHLGKVLVSAAAIVAGGAITFALISGGTRTVESTSPAKPEDNGNNKPGQPALVAREVDPDNEPTSVPTPTSTPSSTPSPLPTNTPQRVPEQPTATAVKEPVAEATARLATTVIKPEARDINLETETINEIIKALKKDLPLNTTITEKFLGVMAGTNISMYSIVGVEPGSNHPYAGSLPTSMSTSRVNSLWSADENLKFIEFARKNLRNTGRDDSKVFGGQKGIFINVNITYYKFNPASTFIGMGYQDNSILTAGETDTGLYRLYWRGAVLVNVATGSRIGSMAGGRTFSTEPTNPLSAAFSGTNYSIKNGGSTQEEIDFMENQYRGRN